MNYHKGIGMLNRIRRNNFLDTIERYTIKILLAAGTLGMVYCIMESDNQYNESVLQNKQQQVYESAEIPNSLDARLSK